VPAVAVESVGDASGLGDVERAVLRLTRQVTDTLAPTDAAFEEVRVHLGDATLVALLMAVSFYAMTVRLLFSLQVTWSRSTSTTWSSFRWVAEC